LKSSGFGQLFTCREGLNAEFFFWFVINQIVRGFNIAEINFIIRFLPARPYATFFVSEPSSAAATSTMHSDAMRATGISISSENGRARQLI
jgi:hypothetical protein